MASSDAELAALQVVRSEYGYTETVVKEGGKPAEKTVEHGRKTGHKLTIEEVVTDR
jgi:hypothetical protein